MVTDAAMESLVQMPELRAVRVLGCNISDAGVATLLALPHLTELDVRNCRNVTKEGIEQLAAKKTLRMLKLGGPGIDDGILELVGQMTQLTGLTVATACIQAGAAEIGSSLPDRIRSGKMSDCCTPQNSHSRSFVARASA